MSVKTKEAIVRVNSIPVQRHRMVECVSIGVS